MTNEEIRAIALEVAKEVNGVHDPRLAEGFVEFATSFLAAITAKAEPIIPTLLYEAHDFGQFADDFDQPLARPIRKAIRDLLNTHPAIEPAPQQHVFYKTGDPDAPEQIKDSNGEVVLAYCRRCKQAEADLTPACPAGAAPLPDEVQWRNIRHAVRTLADWAFGGKDDPRWGTAWLAMVNGLSAKDGPQFNLERLARQVPPDCVVVPREPTEAMCHAAKEAMWVGNIASSVIYKAMIAAGEVKP